MFVADQEGYLKCIDDIIKHAEERSQTDSYLYIVFEAIMLTETHELVESVLDKGTRALVEEAVRAYEGGATRAAIISLWIAVVFDVTSKLRIVSDTGEVKAKQIIAKLDSAVKDGKRYDVQKYESDILDHAKEFELINNRDFIDLKRLQEDRNMCAHPAYISSSDLFKPSAECFRLHLIIAVKTLFSQRPIAGKRLIDTLEQEIDEDSWPESGDLGQYLEERYFAHSLTSVTENIFRILIMTSINSENGENTLKRMNRCRNAVYAASEYHNELFAKILGEILHGWEEKSKLSDDILIRSTGAYGWYSFFWDSSCLPSTARKRILQLISTKPSSWLMENGLFDYGNLSDDESRKLFRDKILNLNVEEVKQIAQHVRNYDCLKPILIGLVKESKTFREAENNLGLLKYAQDYLSSNDIDLLLESIKYNDSNHYSQVRLAADTQNILLDIYDHSHIDERAKESWKKLAKYLHESGLNDKSGYNYTHLCDKVGVGTH